MTQHKHVGKIGLYPELEDAPKSERPMPKTKAQKVGEKLESFADKVSDGIDTAIETAEAFPAWVDENKLNIACVAALAGASYLYGCAGGLNAGYDAGMRATPVDVEMYRQRQREKAMEEARTAPREERPERMIEEEAKPVAPELLAEADTSYKQWKTRFPVKEAFVSKDLGNAA